MKAAGKREQCQGLLEHCRAGAGSTEGQCDGIASLMSVEADFIKEALDAGLYKQAVTLYLQLLQSMVNLLWMMSISAILMTCTVQSIPCNGYMRTS